MLLESTNAEVLKVVYGANNVTVTGTDVAGDTRTRTKLPKLTWCVDSIDSELNAHYRNYIPIGQMMTVGDVKIRSHRHHRILAWRWKRSPTRPGSHVYLMDDLGAGS